MNLVLFVNIKNVGNGLRLTKPLINRLRLDYEVEINLLQNSLIVRALVEIFSRLTFLKALSRAKGMFCRLIW